MFCIGCGNGLADDARFCNICGRAVAQNAQNGTQPLMPQPEQVFEQPYAPQPQSYTPGQQPYAPQPQSYAPGQQPYAPQQPYAQPQSYAPPPSYAQPHRAYASPRGGGGSVAVNIIVPVVVFIVMLLVFTFVTFLAIDSAPGDPALIMLGSDASQADIQLLRQQLDLDGPFIVRYVRMLTGNYGVSLMTREPVGAMIGARLPTTVVTILLGLVVAFVFAIPLGIVSAFQRNKVVDVIFSAFAVICKSLPFFWLSLVLLLVFALNLRLLPIAGADSWEHYILPAFALGIPFVGYAMQTVRATAIKAIGKDKSGLIFPESDVREDNTLMNAVLPNVARSGLQLGWLFGSAMVIEMTFATPGLGRLLLQSVMSRDVPVLLGCLMVLAGCFLAGALVLTVIFEGIAFGLRAIFGKAVVRV